jgi:sugar diacid utilization regulator
MYKYLIIESKKDIKQNKEMIVSLFSGFINLTKELTNGNALYLFYEHETDVSFEEIILNIMSDTISDLRIYVSYHFENQRKLTENMDFIKDRLKRIPFLKYVYLDNKTILKESLNRIDSTLKQQMIRKYTENNDMLKTIKGFLESNQNASKAAKALYVHRNTLIQRLDKFHQVTGFDVKKFKDAFLIYHLL